MQADKRSDENWKTYLKHPRLPRNTENGCESFDQWVDEHKGETLAQNVQDYFESCHDHGYSTSTLWSATSIFKTYLRIKFSFEIENRGHFALE